QTKDGERRKRAERKPSRPDESVADAAERPTQSCAEALDSLGRLAVELGPGQRADGDRRQIWMRVEVVAFARQRRLEALRMNPLREQPKRRLDAKADAVAEQALVVPRALNR